MIISLNLRKSINILCSKSELPSPEEYELLDLTEILARQREILKKDGEIYVLNTSVLNPLDYNSQKMIEMMADLEHGNEER